MKKNILFTILAVLSVLILASCSKKTTTTTAKPTTTLDSFWDSNGNGTADWQESEVNLTYATWQYATDQTTIDSVLIDQFMAKYPNVHITIKDLGAYDGDTWDTALQALAETGDLPDVMLVNRLETTVPYNMLANITDYYDHDADSANIFASLQTSGVYDGIRYAVPSFVYAKWWFVNLDILANAGISAPSYDWTWDQMEAIAKACYNETTNTVGQSGYTQYWMELPKVLKQNSSWAAFTYNTADSSWNFGDSAFEQAMDKLSAALQSNACTSPYGVDEIQQKYGITVTDYALSNGYNIGFDGHAAIWTSPSWVAKDYFSKMNFNWDVYPCPGGTVGGNTDLIGISSTCNNVAAAYQLLKFMSYGEDGVIQRFSDYKQYGSSLYVSADNYPYPIVDYGIDENGVNQIWDNIPYDKVKGMTSSEMINALKNGAFCLNKEVCGWDSVDSAVNIYFYGSTEKAITGIVNGELYATYEATVVSESTRVFKEFNDELKTRIKENSGS